MPVCAIYIDLFNITQTHARIGTHIYIFTQEHTKTKNCKFPDMHACLNACKSTRTCAHMPAGTNECNKHTTPIKKYRSVRALVHTHTHAHKRKRAHNCTYISFLYVVVSIICHAYLYRHANYLTSIPTPFLHSCT